MAENIYFTKEHEWAKIEGDVAVVGITDHAQQALGEVTYIELPAAGRTVEQGDAVASVESSKAASDIYSPVAGDIIEVNNELENSPELINQSCDKDGWVCKIKMADNGAAENLMTAEQYEEYLQSI